MKTLEVWKSLKFLFFYLVMLVDAAFSGWLLAAGWILTGLMCMFWAVLLLGMLQVEDFR